jgi:hypothetical protein
MKDKVVLQGTMESSKDRHRVEVITVNDFKTFSKFRRYIKRKIKK